MLVDTYYMCTFRFDYEKPKNRHYKMIYLGNIPIMNYSQIVNHETIISPAKCALQIKSHLFFGFLASTQPWV